MHRVNPHGKCLDSTMTNHIKEKKKENYPKAMKFVSENILSWKFSNCKFIAKLKRPLIESSECITMHLWLYPVTS